MSWYIEWTIIDWTSCRLDYWIGVKKRSPRWCMEMSVDKEWGGHRSESGSPSCQHQTALPSLFYEIWLGGRGIVKFTKEIVRQTTQSKEMDYRDAVVKSLQYHFVTSVVNFHQNYLPNQHFLSKLTFAKFFAEAAPTLSWKLNLVLEVFSVSEQELMQKVLFGNQKFSLSFSLFFLGTHGRFSQVDQRSWGGSPGRAAGQRFFLLPGTQVKV